MNIEETISGSVCILTPHGDIWDSGGWSLHENVKDAVERGLTNVVFDLHLIERINSLGIGMLAACLKTLRDKDGDLRIARANTKVSDMLKLVNLYTILSLHDTVDDAVAGF